MRPLSRLLPLALLALWAGLAPLLPVHGDDLTDGQVRDLLRAVAGPDESARRAAEERLLAAPAARTFEPCRKALATGARATRVFAARALARARNPQATRALLGRMLDDDDAPVRAAAARAVVALAGRDAAWELVPALGNAAALRRMRAAQGLALLGNPYTAGPLVRVLRLRIVGGGGPRAHIFVGGQTTYVKDYDVEIAPGAVAYDPIVGVIQTGTVLDARVHSVEHDITIEERLVYAGALRDLTGQDFGVDADAWADWWDKSAEAFTAEYRAAKRASGERRAAVRALADGRAAEEREDFEEALRLYRRIEGDFGQFPEAQEAAARREGIEASAYAMGKVEERQSSATARNWLSMAKSFAANGLTARAAEYARRVVDTYPASAEAAEARALLAGGGAAGGTGGK
ncbi:MAG: HEAT repeat domain-containing protein [Planctomycetes bacterium]|nr:HEAT repeat domain-containing protein [Planctomycetota bacterium]